VSLSKAQRKRFTDRGLSKAEIDEMETMLDADNGEGGNGDKPTGSGRVVVYEGGDAESFMERMFGGAGGGGTSSTKDEADDAGGADEDAGTDDAGDDEGSDEEPGAKNKWFR
jgi:hypothetical protein